MIPEVAITHWRNIAPWPQDTLVEQDLILSRAIIEIIQEPALAKELLLRPDHRFAAVPESPLPASGTHLWVGPGTREAGGPRRPGPPFGRYPGSPPGFLSLRPCHWTFRSASLRSSFCYSV